MVVRQLLVKLGVQTDAASVAEGFAWVEGLKKGLELVAEAAKEASRFMLEQISATAEAGEEASHTSQRLGLHADQLQRLSYVAGLSGVSLDELAVSMQHLARLGVRDVNAKMLQLADQFQRMPDSGRKTALAMNYFGRAGARLIPLLNRGSGAIRELMGEADSLGVVMSKEDLEATEKYTESIRRLEASGRGLRNTVVVPLLGLLSKLADFVTKNVKAFREWYKGTILAAGGIQRVMFYVKTLGEALLTLGAIWALQLIDIAAVVAALGALTLANIAAAAEAVASWLLAAAPWILMAAGIALVLLWLQDFYTFLSGGDSVIGRVIKAWKTQFGTLGDFLHDLWTTIKYEAGELWDWLGKQIKKIPGVDFLIHAVTDNMPDTKAQDYGFGGGAISPTTAAIRSARANVANSTNSNQFQANVTVNVQGDADGKKVGQHVTKALEEFHTRKMREARAAAP